MSDAIDLEIFRQLKESPEDRYGNEDTLLGQSIAQGRPHRIRTVRMCVPFFQSASAAILSTSTLCSS